MEKVDRVCPEHGEFIEVFDECPVCWQENHPARQDIGPYLILDEMLDGEEFYDLCQAYRFAPIGDQAAVSKAFEAIKNYLKGIE